MKKYDIKKVKRIMSIRDNQINIDAHPRFFEKENAAEIMLQWLEKAGNYEKRFAGNEKWQGYHAGKRMSDKLLEMFEPAIIK